MSVPNKILFVDDDASLLAAFQRNFRKRFVFDTALGGEEALRLLQTSGPYAVVLADMNMPGMSGIELLEHIRELSPDSIRLMLTGNADQQTAVDSVNRASVFRFLNKPCPPEVLVPALEAALKEYQLLHVERELLEGTLAGSVKLLTDVLGMVAPDALGRGQRLQLSMAKFARHLALTPVWELEMAALLSFIGYAAVPPHLLSRASFGELTSAEAAILRRAPQTGHDLLADIPRLAGVAQSVRYQRKNFDGSGFPSDAIAGEAIPLGARLLRILTDRLELEADGVVKQKAFDAMSARPGCYDPRLLAECFRCFPFFLPNSLSPDQEVFALSAAQITPGQIVVSDICTHSELVLVGAGHQLTAASIQRIRNFAELGELKEPLLVQASSVTTTPVSVACGA